MIAWEYVTLRASHGKWYASVGVAPEVDAWDDKPVAGSPYPVNELGRLGWEVYQVTERISAPTHYDSEYRITYYMKRRRDRFCAACVQAVETMDKLEQVAP